MISARSALNAEKFLTHDSGHVQSRCGSAEQGGRNPRATLFRPSSRGPSQPLRGRRGPPVDVSRVSASFVVESRLFRNPERTLTPRSAWLHVHTHLVIRSDPFQIKSRARGNINMADEVAPRKTCARRFLKYSQHAIALKESNKKPKMDHSKTRLELCRPIAFRAPKAAMVSSSTKMD